MMYILYKLIGFISAMIIFVGFVATVKLIGDRCDGVKVEKINIALSIIGFVGFFVFIWSLNKAHLYNVEAENDLYEYQVYGESIVTDRTKCYDVKGNKMCIVDGVSKDVIYYRELED